jgi:hypothetical protein
MALIVGRGPEVSVIGGVCGATLLATAEPSGYGGELTGSFDNPCADRLMAKPDEISPEDLRKAVLNVADAVRLISETLDRLGTSLRLNVPPLGLDPTLARLRDTLRTTNGRLSAAVDLLVKTDGEPSS